MENTGKNTYHGYETRNACPIFSGGRVSRFHLAPANIVHNKWKRMDERGKICTVYNWHRHPTGDKVKLEWDEYVHMSHADHRCQICSFSWEVPVRSAMGFALVANVLQGAHTVRKRSD